MNIDDEQAIIKKILAELYCIRKSKDPEKIEEFLQSITQLGLEIDNHIRVIHTEFPAATKDFFKYVRAIPLIHHTDKEMNCDAQRIIDDVHLGEKTSLRTKSANKGHTAINKLCEAIAVIYGCVKFPDEVEDAEVWLKFFVPELDSEKAALIDKINKLEEPLPAPGTRTIWADILVDYIDLLGRAEGDDDFIIAMNVSQDEAFEARRIILDASKSYIKAQLRELQTKAMKRNWPLGRPDPDKDSVGATNYDFDKRTIDGGTSLVGGDLKKQAKTQGIRDYLNAGLKSTLTLPSI
jgi:hypothetical protein